jgi:hypothetical protein
MNQSHPYPGSQDNSLTSSPENQVEAGKHGSVSAPALADQRLADRYHFRRPPLATFLIESASQAHWAPIHDLSERGLALVFSQCLSPGTLVTVRLRGLMTTRSWDRLAQVRHATPLPEGKWLLGCHFTTGPVGDEATSLVDDELFGFTDDEISSAIGNRMSRLTPEEVDALLSENVLV